MHNTSMPIRILYDGWPLVHSPLSAAAWHLRTLLAMNLEDVQPIMALPTEQNEADLGNGWETVFDHTRDRGEWEQRSLQHLAMEHKANLIHSTSLAASLFGKIPTMISPAETEAANRSRLGEALGRGGLARAKILWPNDMPEAKLPGELRRLPPVVHPEFSSSRGDIPVNQNLPEEFLLLDGIPNEEAALQLLESWTWAAASIGELYPLVVVGINDAMQKFLLSHLPEFHVQESVQMPSSFQAQEFPNIYKACTALVHLGSPAPWGNPLRSVLACGKAIVAQKEANTEAIVVSAAYLIEPEDLRSFGAAMITVVVDEKAREKLENAARDRAAHWSAKKYQDALITVYREKL